MIHDKDADLPKCPTCHLRRYKRLARRKPETAAGKCRVCKLQVHIENGRPARQAGADRTRAVIAGLGIIPGSMANITQAVADDGRVMGDGEQVYNYDPDRSIKHDG